MTCCKENFSRRDITVVPHNITNGFNVLKCADGVSVLSSLLYPSCMNVHALISPLCDGRPSSEKTQER